MTRAVEPFVGDPLPWERAVDLIKHIATAGGHSGVMMRGSRQVRVTYLRPDDVYNRDIGLPGFVLRGETWDERVTDKSNGWQNENRWRPFEGWTAADVTASWCELAHTYTDKIGRCASPLCAQYGHAGGLELVRGKR